MTRQQNSGPDTTEARPAPIECAPWCVYGDGHGDALFAEDQWCGSEELRVELSQHPRLEAERLDEHGEWVSIPDYVQVSATRSGPGAETTFDLDHAGGPPISFTESEWRQLVENMQLALDQAGNQR